MHAPPQLRRDAAALVGRLVAGSVGLTAGITLALLTIAELLGAS